MPLTAAESAIAAEIASRHDRLLADLRRFVDLETGPGGDSALTELRDLLAQRAQALGATREDRPGDPRPDWLDWSPRQADAPQHQPPPTCVLRRPHPTLPRILIAGHLDTVHPPSSLGGTFRGLSIAPGRATATGPGCVDMKGGLVIAIHALEALEARGIPASWSFVLNSDEETGSYCSDAALRALAAEHDLGLALEPAMANGELAITRGGSGQFAFHCSGRAAHVGRDFASGVSAVDALARAILAAHALSDPARGINVSVGPLSGGIAPNVVPDHAAAWGNARVPDAKSQALVEAALRAIAAGGPDALPHVRVLTSFNRPAKPLSPATERLALAARRAAEDLGQSLPFASSAGVCDGNNLQDAGLPTIDTLGVRGGGLHTPQEWIDLSSLVQRCQLLALLIARASAGGV